MTGDGAGGHNGRFGSHDSDGIGASGRNGDTSTLRDQFLKEYSLWNAELKFPQLVLERYIERLCAEVAEETAKAYGGCTNCYGKGYHTQRETAGSYKTGTWELNPYIPCPKCDRGTQFEKAMEYAAEDMRRRCLSKVHEIRKTPFGKDQNGEVYLAGSGDMDFNNGVDAAEAAITSIEI